ncbi:MAG: pyridoxal phosphate-dependent aminotransferase family protein [Coriobacteriia bacterium]|nr:pyridoxal phosphate-dependent aminotransferase family protein [Coriobacteriia bacterium]MCL2537252.1 pyridoxal phosphate-dependent aminotransferase family protein [Coriobacteriia bacterium]
MLQTRQYDDAINARFEEFDARYQGLKAADRYFYLKEVVGKVNNRVKLVDGSELVMLASYSYLGLMGHPKIEAAAKEAIDFYGTGAGGVRLLTGNTDLHEKLEARTAAYSKREAAAVYTSGFLTNVAAISALLTPKDMVVMDKLDHASIVDGCLLSGARWRTFRHNDMDHLESILKRAKGKYESTLVVVDSVYSMDGDMCDLPSLRRICDEYGARLMVDEAHSVGALGKTGHGIEEHFDMYGSIDIKMGTFSKAIPSVGGYIAGDAKLVNYLKHNSRPFIFSAGLPPAQCGAAIAALDVIEQEPERVQRLQAVQGEYARGLMELGFDTMETSTAIVPVHIGDEMKTLDLTHKLFERGIFVCPIVHPAVPKGTERLRTCLMATHTEEDLAKIFEMFEKSGKELGII